MAKKSMIARDVKRKKMVERFSRGAQHSWLRSMPLRTQWSALRFTAKSKVCLVTARPNRVRNRCWATGKPRGVYRDFGLCRNQLRERAHKGELPGVVKSSW
jgi:small subunit ribosomal protein S14